MKIRQISIYNEFCCVGADCPVNCCRGWRIPIDPATCEKYLTEKEKLGSAFRWAVKLEDEVPSIRSVFERCPFWGRDHLCGIQKKHGAEYMPRICRQFPRRLYHLGFFSEETLYLACPEAARLFCVQAKQGEHFPFQETEGEVTYESCTTNDDEAFLNDLLAARQQLIGMLEQGWRFDSMAFLEYGRAAQEACLNGEPCPEPLEYQGFGDAHYEIRCKEINRLFDGGFYHPYLRKSLPFLYQLCRTYLRTLGDLGRKNENAADRRLACYQAELSRKLPETELILNRYYEYYLQTDFLNIFEDYSFSKHLLYGMRKTAVLWVFLALYAREREHITEDEIAKIIAVCERRAPHFKKVEI